MSAGFIALGVVQGALAALNAIGLVLVWRATRILNLAQPAIGLVGGVLSGLLVSSAGWGFGWAAPVGIAVGALLGYGSERLVLARLADAPRVVPLVATIGLAQLFGALQTGLPFAFGGRLPSYDVDLGVEWFVFPVLLKGAHLLAILSLPIAVIAVLAFVHRSRLGTAAAAVGQDAERAQTLGVDVGFVRSVVWAVAGGLSGLAGVLSIPALGFSLGDGVAPTVLLLALAPAMLAGLRSIGRTVALSLTLGVVYQLALVKAPTAGLADALLAAAVLVALAIGRTRGVRLAVAARASSWAAAATPRRVPRRLQRDRRWRILSWTGALALPMLVALPPAWLSPSADVRYATSAALVLAAVSCGIAWTFAGEVALGQWGVAALAAGVAFLLPGPPAVGAVGGVAAGAAVGLLLDVVGRRRGGLASAIGGIAVSVAAPVFVLRLGAPAWALDPDVVAPGAAVTAAVVAVAFVWLRSRRLGIEMVAARDEPRRSASLGTDVARVRALAMAFAGATAGLAGVVYLAAVPAGIAPEAFASSRSLEVLAFAVVGGLGSALGAGLGAAVLLAADALLPSPWAAIATGAGVVWVVVVAPAGFAAVLAQGRDALVRLLLGGALVPKRDAPLAPPPAVDGDDDPEAVVAGSDTRDALAVGSVRAAAGTAFFLAAPALAALFGLPLALRDHLSVEVGAMAPWLLLGLATLAAIAAVAGFTSARLSFVGVAKVAAVASATAAGFVAIDDEVALVVMCVLAVFMAGWSLGILAGGARRTVVARSRSAASGLVLAGAAAGGIGAVHLAAVAAGSGLLSSARWAVGYGLSGAVAAAVAGRRSADDALRAAVRDRDRLEARRVVGRRRWAPLRLDDVSVEFGGRRVLDAVDLEVGPGQLVALVGTNGSGKSTLLRVVAGFVEPDRGRVALAGQDVSGLRADERAAAGVAFVNGARPVFPDLTVRENLRVGAFLTHRRAASFDEALAHVLTLVPRLRDRLDTIAGALSGGEQRHLAVAQSLFRRPAVLLADELTLGLDRAAQATVHGLLRTLADDGIAVVVVDHDLDQLVPVADVVVALHDGRVVSFDTPSAFVADGRHLVQARFLAGSRP